MPLPPQENMLKFVRRHAHDVRNHCSGIDLDATLLAELSEDPEIMAIATRLKKQVARIELDLKLLLLKMEEPRPVTITVGDLIQLWRMKLQPVPGARGSVNWPEVSAGTPITLDTRLTVQALCDLALRAWDGDPSASLEVMVRSEAGRVLLDVIHPPGGPQPAANFVEEMAAVLALGGLDMNVTLDPGSRQWIITLAIPING